MKVFTLGIIGLVFITIVLGFTGLEGLHSYKEIEFDRMFKAASGPELLAMEEEIAFPQYMYVIITLMSIGFLVETFICLILCTDEIVKYIGYKDQNIRGNIKFLLKHSSNIKNEYAISSMFIILGLFGSMAGILWGIKLLISTMPGLTILGSIIAIGLIIFLCRFILKFILLCMNQGIKFKEAVSLLNPAETS